jgi:quercetin dioxygenase-like cupin family protein
MTRPSTNVPKAGDHQAFDVFGETVIIRHDPAGPLLNAAVIEEIVPPNGAAPLHRHSREDEICYVIEGTFRIWRGDEAIDVGQGGIALLPRHQVHTFKNVSAGPGRLLTVILPAGFEQFFAVVAERHLGDEDMDEIVAVVADFGLEILSLPPNRAEAKTVSYWLWPTAMISNPAPISGEKTGMMRNHISSSSEAGHGFRLQCQ